ncbi:MAG: 30S ribosomal protein S9 [Candidatus Taylorbacteria bacterium RIFCSPHIGHO2_02_FULL_44_36]|nr:MAG: 30S ribosomal protein S9 [Candidatus Taylorbacteria bacterium RIFCSPHIGHO2_02_FULL_44_36]OHA39358.1 MAG: 30S ribosomal protein S9 [Candidatus Taylorbacteria bacterium RIFCSPLOWO2_02_FULL_44_35]
MEEKKETKNKILAGGRYLEAVGRRKTSIARVRLFANKTTTISVNEKPLAKYFPTKELQDIAIESLKELKISEHFAISVKVKGGGSHSQAEAIRHGLARTLVAYDVDSRKILKPAGFLKRDPRAKERRKFGLKKARKAPQWSKR